eukprot:6760544-Alexandrium_andersonii.AAC.1
MVIAWLCFCAAGVAFSIFGRAAPARAACGPWNAHPAQLVGSAHWSSSAATAARPAAVGGPSGRASPTAC